MISFFSVNSFYPGVSVNLRYTQVQQKLTIAGYVGDELADKYVTSQQYLARGHLAAKTDFIYATGQRATFYFINAAPQWQPFNNGNWNWLEQVHIPKLLADSDGAAWTSSKLLHISTSKLRF